MTSGRELAQGILMYIYITGTSNSWEQWKVLRGEKARAERMEGRRGRAGPCGVLGVSTGKDWFFGGGQAEVGGRGQWATTEEP